MNSRQRMIAAFQFAGPDRLPVFYHASTAGLYVHGRKLLDLFRAYPPDNAVTFEAIPLPPPGTVDARGQYHEIRADEWGTVWDYRIFGVAGLPHRYPIEAWDAPLEFPPVPAIGSEQFLKDWERVQAQRRNHLVFDGWIGLLEKLHALRPFEEVLMDLADRKPSLLAFLDRLTEYYRRQIEYLLAIGTDVIMFADDWGAQTSLLVAPKVFREVYKPRLRQLMALVHGSGAKVFYHSCGTVHPLYRDLVEIGINGLWHQIALYDAEQFAREAAENRTVLFLHMDRQYLVPRGTPREITETVKRYADIHRRLGGGAILYVEIENDAPFENVEALITAAHRYA
jgi:uroporphyrinogen-III decarboxylase